MWNQVVFLTASNQMEKPQLHSLHSQKFAAIIVKQSANQSTETSMPSRRQD